jgi:hypothetical protein
MDNNMREHNEIAKQKIYLMESMFQQRKQDIQDARSALSRKVELVTQMAKEMGITAATPTLFKGLYKIIHNESSMNLFIANGIDERILIIQEAARVDN